MVSQILHHPLLPCHHPLRRDQNSSAAMHQPSKVAQEAVKPTLATATRNVAMRATAMLVQSSAAANALVMTCTTLTLNTTPLIASITSSKRFPPTDTRRAAL